MEIHEENKKWAAEVWGKIDKKMQLVAPRNKGKLPKGCVNGSYDNTLDLPDGDIYWTNGFWGAMMWLLYSQTKNDMYKDVAILSEQLLDSALAKTEALYHDVGFMWHLTSGASYKLTGDMRSMRRNMAAANALAARFNMKGGFIRALNGEQYPDGNGEVSKGMTIIDTMMNLPLLYWASEIVDDDRYKQIAVAHADTTMKQHLRPDGSVNHIVLHDIKTGEMTGTRGGQGYGLGSSWSRGQAWAVYGFALSYKYTGDERYLNAAKSAAHYFISCVSDDYLPRADFRAPSEPKVYDSSAGAITACGLFEIARHVGEFEKETYIGNAYRLLRAMDENFCDYTDKDSILQMTSGSYGGDRNINLIYADYFWIEAISQAMGNDSFMW